MGYECKASMMLKAEGDAGRFSGYASTYNLDLQNDRIQPGAFAQSIADKKGKVPIFFNHEDWVGFSTSLAEDGKGLNMTAELALGNTISDNAYALLQKAAQLDFRVGMSIGFTATDWDWDGNVRTLKEINLYEVSITPFPAQPKAFVSDVKTWRDFEKHLREAEHFSRADAKRILNALAACKQSSCGMPEDANQPLTRRLLSVL
jgi:HK97 family phage prohead protease